MSSEQISTITLRALRGRPLADEGVRSVVTATAEAIAERTGIEIASLSISDESITATLLSGRIEAMGFAAELRRVTTAWYTNKHDQATLWGDANRDEDDEAGEAWKNS